MNYLIIKLQKNKKQNKRIRSGCGINQEVAGTTAFGIKHVTKTYKLSYKLDMRSSYIGTNHRVGLGWVGLGLFVWVCLFVCLFGLFGLVVLRWIGLSGVGVVYCSIFITHNEEIQT